MSVGLLKSLKKQVGIGKVLESYRLYDDFKRRGDQLVGPCPIHGGDNPTAFRVHLGRGIWHCFTHCGGGDTVDLLCRIEGCSYAQAARILQRMATNKPVPTRFQSSVPASVVSTSFQPFRRQIRLNPQAPFLQQNKGITLETAKRFEAGLPDPKSRFLEGTVAVRLYDMQGFPLGYCGRRMDPEDISRWGKWRFPTRFPKSQVLYNAHRALSARRTGIVVVECPWAAMRLTQAGIPGVVALLGTTISEKQLAWLSQAPALLVLLDGDHAGRTCAESIAHSLGQSTAVRIHELPAEKEPEDLLDSELTALVDAYFPFFLNPPYLFGGSDGGMGSERL